MNLHQVAEALNNTEFQGLYSLGAQLREYLDETTVGRFCSDVSHHLDSYGPASAVPMFQIAALGDPNSFEVRFKLNASATGEPVKYFFFTEACGRYKLWTKPEQLSLL